MSDSPSCAVVVCTTHGRLEPLQRCLEALSVADPRPAEIVVVDNTEGDPDIERLVAGIGARYAVEPRPGLSRARNLGGAIVRSAVVAFIDDDAVPVDGWIRHLAAPFADRRVAATTGRIVPARHWSSPEGATSGEDLGPWPRRVDRDTEDWFEIAVFGGMGLGPNMAVRGDVFPDRFAFREDLGLPFEILGEEHRLFFDLIRAGHAVSYVPEAVVEHRPIQASADPVAYERRVGGAAAFALMLAVEEPDYRWRTVRYALGAMSGGQRRWQPEYRRGRRSRWRAVSAAVNGVGRYARHRTGRSRGVPGPRLRVP